VSEAKHIVTVEAVEPVDEYPPNVKFTCTGTRESECHNYPSGEDWDDDDGGQDVAHDECWIQGWMDNDAYLYVGPDRVEGWSGYESVPNVSRSGEIEAAHMWDYIEWKFKEESDE